MTYASRETSVDSGSPVELYEFRLGVNTWRLTSAKLDAVYLGNTFAAALIQRGRIEQKNEIRREDLTVTLARDAVVAQNFVASPPSAVMLLTVFEQHFGDAETVPVWSGRVVNARWRDSTVELRCEAIFTGLLRTGPRRVYQTNCPYALYDLDCKVNPVLFRVSGTVSGVAGISVQVAAAASQAAGWFDGGYLEWTRNGIQEVRMIETHSGVNLTLLSPPFGLFVGAPVQLLPGCARTLSVCLTKFNNTDNYGGFPYRPPFNPFGGSTLF